METSRPRERNRERLAGCLHCERLARHEIGAAGPPRASRLRRREIVGYSPVWSSTSAPGAFFWTDSIPFSADALRSYISLLAMTWPLVATRLKWYLPLDDFLSTNLPAILPP